MSALAPAYDTDHYRDYLAGAPDVEGPLLLVIGNCQAESVRLLLDPEGRRSVRVPPVFEMGPDDVEPLRGLLGRTGALLAQPVADDYAGLPLGTRQLVDRLPRRARAAVAPVVRWTGLHPLHVVHHPPDAPPGPPVVPYHDLRTLARWNGLPSAPDLGEDAVRAVGEASRAELARREQTCDVAVSDLFVEPRPYDMRTINHPGERVLLALAQRAAQVLDLSEPSAPQEPLLDSVEAPIEADVARAWGHDTATTRGTWRVDGEEVPVEEVAVAHTHWYDEHPEVARTIWERFASTAAPLGLRP